jgi:hypothetical protein
MSVLLSLFGPFVSSRILSSLRGSVVHDQHHAEAGFALHHASVTIGSLFQGNCLYHGANVFEDAEGKGDFAFDPPSAG